MALRGPKLEIVGERIGKGAQHKVSMVSHINGRRIPEKTLVVKRLHATGRLWDRNGLEELRTVQNFQHLNLVRTGFTGPAVIEEIESGRGELIEVDQSLLQEYVDAPELDSDDLKVSEIREQMTKALCEAWRHYQKNGQAVDFLAFEAFAGFGEFIMNKKNTLGVHNVRKVSEKDRLSLGLQNVHDVLVEVLKDEEGCDQLIVPPQSVEDGISEIRNQIVLVDSGFMEPGKLRAPLSWFLQFEAGLQFDLLSRFVDEDLVGHEIPKSAAIMRRMADVFYGVAQVCDRLWRPNNPNLAFFANRGK